uniref:PDZ domain-containing protein n=1 Tax=Tetraodon nigroviridis TaxID=99883 RepID=H3DAL5_TETNG
MKVTVTFGDTAVVVPCKAGWTVRDLVDQATRRYRRILEQHGQCAVKTHHLEYAEGGILDVDDMLIDLVEDRDKLVAVFDEVQAGRTASPSETMSNGYSSSASPEPLHYFPHLDYKEPIRGEIEVNEAVLKANTPLLVRRAVIPPWPLRFRQPRPRHLTKTARRPWKRKLTEMLFDHQVLRTVSVLLSSRELKKNLSFSLTRTVKFPGDWGPLGIHVVPYCSSLSGRTLGLHIKGIEEDSLAKKENLFQEDECIVQINNVPLQDKTFAQSQDVFRQAMATPSVQLEILSVANRTRYEKGLIGQLFTGDGKDLSAKTKSPMLVRAKERVSPTALAPQTRPTSTSPTPKVRSQSPLVAKSPVIPGLPNLTSKKGGKRIKIDLKKGAEGLGFTVVTRDSSVHEPGPILVKNILQRGAAVKDGRLQPGDRILEVNGVDMTGRSQEELVAMLRSTKQGESVSVVVARQEDLFLPRELKGEDAGSLVLEDGREQLMYEIPLNETGSAGLGVSLKGNKSRETGEDLGIFIKSIIHGGAAYKDGRLSVNDQLIAINGESLLGRSNHAAMETLRRSMSSEGNSRGTIQLVVLRAPHQRVRNKNPVILISHSNCNKSCYSSVLNPRLSRPPVLIKLRWCTQAHKWDAAILLYSSVENTMATLESTTKAVLFGRGLKRHSWTDGPDVVVYFKQQHLAAGFNADNQLAEDNTPRNRTSKSMDLVADESNMDSLVRQRNEPSADRDLGPTLGLKSSSLESLQTAVSEAKQSRSQAQVPFHRPRPQVVRGRGCNQSFRIAIDKSYDGPSEDDDDLSEHSSGHETPASSSSRQDLDEPDESVEDAEKKTKRREKDGKIQLAPDRKDKDNELGLEPELRGEEKCAGGLSRFGKKKEDKSKASKNKLEALSEEELERIPNTTDGYDPRYAEIRSGRLTPDPASLPDFEDDDSDPNYARISNFRQPPAQTSRNRTPPPGGPAAGSNPPQASLEELDGLYAKVNKTRAP